MPATITDIYPKKIFEPGDTVYLKGKNFLRKPEVSLYAKAKSGHSRYRTVPSSYILSSSDTLIEMIIPRMALKDDGCDLDREWYPTSGQIKITKGHGQFEVMTWSKESIEIKDTALK